MLPLSREDGKIKPFQEGKQSFPVRKKIPFYLISAFLVHDFPSSTLRKIKFQIYTKINSILLNY